MRERAMRRGSKTTKPRECGIVEGISSISIYYPFSLQPDFPALSFVSDEQRREGGGGKAEANKGDAIFFYLRAEMTRVAANAIPAMAVTPAATPTFHRPPPAQIPAAPPPIPSPPIPARKPMLQSILRCSHVHTHIDQRTSPTLAAPPGSFHYHHRAPNPASPPPQALPTYGKNLLLLLSGLPAAALLADGREDRARGNPHTGDGRRGATELKGTPSPDAHGRLPPTPPVGVELKREREREQKFVPGDSKRGIL